MTTRGPLLDVRRGGQRATTRGPGVVTRHSFSFGEHYDPGDTGFAVMVACNEDLLQPGAGYTPHVHRDVEVVTWLSAGELVHEDPTGTRVLRGPAVQALSAGSGVRHAERASDAGPAHLVQVWLLPDDVGGPAAYDAVELEGSRDLDGRGWVALVVSADGAARDGAPLRVRCAGAAMHVARVAEGEELELPAAPYAHLLVVHGAVDVPAVGVLRAGDALRASGPTEVPLTARSPSELLAWLLPPARSEPS